LAWLTDLETAASDSMHITGTQIGLLKTFDAEILTEAARNEHCGMLRIFATPSGVVGEGVAVDRLLGTAVHRQVCLRITLEAQERHVHRFLDRLFHKRARHAFGTERCDLADMN